MNDPDRSFLKIPVPAGGDIQELLGVPVHQGEPAALDLYHDAVSRLKGMGDLIQVESHFRYLPWHQWLGLLVAVPELAAEHFSPYQPLESRRLPAGGASIRTGQYIDQFNHDIP